MVHSTWGEWFVREEIEAYDPEGLSLWYLGCNGFVVRTPETTVYVDPFFGDGEPPWTIRMIPVPLDPTDATACDAVLVTHEHLDHMHEPSYWPLVDDLGADLYAPAAAFTDPDYEPRHELPEAQAHTITAGDAIKFDDLTVHVTAGNDPDAIEAVSYVFEHESGTYFNSGDSRPDPAFEAVGAEFDIDVGSVTLGTVGRINQEGTTTVQRWYSDENDAIELTNALEIDHLLPVHYDMWKGVRADPKSLHEHAASFAYPRTLHRIEVGDRFDVGRPGVAPLRSLEN